MELNGPELPPTITGAGILGAILAIGWRIWFVARADQRGDRAAATQHSAFTELVDELRKEIDRIGDARTALALECETLRHKLAVLEADYAGAQSRIQHLEYQLTSRRP